MKFIVSGDTHFGLRYEEIAEREDKYHEGIKLAKYCSENDIDCVLLCGDLTDHGYGTFCFKRDPDECAALIAGYVQPFKSAGVELFMCRGNHDTYCNIWPQYFHPVRRLICKEYGDINYVRTVKGVRIISLDICPTKSSLKWLKSELENNSNVPTILQFHYEFRAVDTDRWWSPEIKEKLFQVVRDHNIICICVGHIHMTDCELWRGIPVISGSDKNIMLCEYTKQAGLIYFNIFL